MNSRYNELLHEFYDLSNKKIRKALIQLSESDNETAAVEHIAHRLYDNIVAKVDDIDFGSIPQSRGDITKIENYDMLIQCVDNMRNLLVKYREDTSPIDVIENGIQNIKSRKDIFAKAYALNVEMPIIMYNSMVLAVVASISYLIAGCIEYMKDAGSSSFIISLSKINYNKNKNNLLFANLRAFNTACAKGDVDVAIDQVIKANKNLVECGGEEYVINPNGSMAITIKIDSDKDERTKDAFLDDDEEEAPVTEPVAKIHESISFSLLGKSLFILIKTIIPIIQQIVYFFFHTRQNISDYFAIQAEFLQMNAYEFQYTTTIEVSQRKKIYDRQMKIADNLKKVSNFFAIDYNRSKVNAENLAAKEKAAIKAEDIDTSSDLFRTSLF